MQLGQEREIKYCRLKVGVKKDAGWTGVIKNLVLMEVLWSCFSTSLPLIRQSFVLSCAFKINKVWGFALATRWHIKSVTCVRMNACLKEQWDIIYSHVSHEVLISFYSYSAVTWELKTVFWSRNWKEKQLHNIFLLVHWAIESIRTASAAVLWSYSNGFIVKG